jgi:hypothetical protein
LGHATEVSDGEVSHGNDVHPYQDITADEVSLCYTHAGDDDLLRQRYIDEERLRLVWSTVNTLNLSDSGRDQAAAINDLLRDYRIGRPSIPDGVELSDLRRLPACPWIPGWRDPALIFEDSQ